MNPWSGLVKTALLGTRRQPLELVGANPPLEHLLRQLSNDEAEHQLLSAAGSTFIYQQIGEGPLHFSYQHPGPVLGQDPRPTCSAATALMLARMLTSSRRSHLSECLAAIDHAGQRLPPSLVPNFLALGYKTPILRPLIIPLLSATDRRLAALHPDWLYASPACDTWHGAWAIWQEISQTSKIRFIQQLRVTRPELGRQLLESSWKTEPDTTRMNLIKQLETGLGTADEPFLEMALDDRSHHIRRRSAELLAAIPGSRLGERMTVHVQHFLRWTPAGIHIRFPEVTTEMVRDGVYGMNSKKPAYVRSKQLVQMVSAIPLSFWTTRWNPKPQVIIDAAMATNWKRTLTSGFAEAAFYQGDSQWAKAILWGRGPGILPAKLIDLLALDDYGQWLDHLLLQEGGRPNLTFRGPLFKSIRYRQKLNEPLAIKILELLAGYMALEQTTIKVNLTEKRAFEAVALQCPVTILPQAKVLLGDSRQITSAWQPTADNILKTLHFRQEMLEEVANIRETNDEGRKNG